jgi:uncharacterized FlgJ-related protein
MLPLLQPESIEWRVRIFKNKCESVKYYIKILNTKKVYEEFRKVRETTSNKDSILMAKTLGSFSTNEEYKKHVVNVIKNLKNEIK